MSFGLTLTGAKRLPINSDLNIIVDGNSIYTDYGGTPIHTLISDNALFDGVTASFSNVARSGASWIDMIAAGSSVDNLVDTDKVNILVCAETANACNTGGFTSNVRSGEQAWVDCTNYIRARKLANPSLKVILCGTTPSNIGSTWDSRVNTFEELARLNYRKVGADRFVNFRTTDSPAFNHVNDLATFQAYPAYWSDVYLHLTTVGKTEMVRQICNQGISRLYR
jgi:hypothetical protein